MARLNDFMTRIDLSALSKYVEAHGKIYVYAKGDMLARQGHVCRHIGIVKSGYFKYVTLNSKEQEVATGFSFEGEVVTDYVHSFLCDRPSLTSIVAGCDSEVLCVPVDELRRYSYLSTTAPSRSITASARAGRSKPSTSATLCAMMKNTCS